MKERTSFTLSPEAKRLIRVLAGKLGLSMASVIEQAVRLLAEQQHIPSSEAQP